MRILLTGATGCLGSCIVRRLLRVGYEVICLKRSFSDMWRVKAIANDMEWVDVDAESIENVFKRHRHIDAVVHMATNYGRNGETAADIMQTNVMFPLEILQWASFFHVDVFYNTDTLLGKNISIYSLSKSNFSEWGKWFSEHRDIEFINLRIDHMYGENDATHKFIPYLIDKFKQNVPEIDLTEGNQKRDFIHLDDVVEAYLTVMEQSKRLSAYDVGSGTLTSIRQLAEMLKKMTGASTRLNFGAIPYRKYEVMEPEVDIAPLRKLGWCPKVSLEDGLKRTVETYPWKRM